MRDLRDQAEIMSKWTGDIRLPVVSICCLTYNHAAYVEDALKGFLIQETNFPFEILIHDDASSDQTQSIIRAYEEKYPQIIKAIYQNQNQYSKGVNVGVEFNLKRANGAYVALCEGDDYWVDPSKLQKQIDFLERNKGYVITYTDCDPIDESGISLVKNFGGAKRDLSSNELVMATPIYTLTSCFRNVLKERVWPRELVNAEYGDLTIWSQLGEYGKGKFLGNIQPSIYRVHSEGLHSSKSTEFQQQMYLQTLFCIYRYWQVKQRTKNAKLILNKIVLNLLDRMSLVNVFEMVVVRFCRGSKRTFKNFLRSIIG